jgi:hypothetical protein
MASYTLRFPFRLAPIFAISGLDQARSTVLGSLSISLTQDKDFYILTIKGFDSEQEAQAYVRNISVGLNWLLLDQDLAIQAQQDLSTVAYAEDPIKAAKILSSSFNLEIEGPVDGLANGNFPSVYPSDKHLRFAYVGEPNVILVSEVDDVILSFREAMRSMTTGIIDKKLETALELYNAHYFERSERVRFLLLVIALEALATTQRSSVLIQELIEQWQQQINSSIEDNPQQRQALESLKSRLGSFKDNSITNQIQQLVMESLANESDADIQEYVKQIPQIYNYRSKIVHDGSISNEQIRDIVPQAQAIVQKVLKARFKQSYLNRTGD